MNGRGRRSKGANAEREVAAILRRFGIEARRTPLSGGMQWKGDLRLSEPWHVEIKRQETAQIPKWWGQTIGDCPDGHTPMLVFRANHEQWRVLLRLEDFLHLVRGGKDANLGHGCPDANDNEGEGE